MKILLILLAMFLATAIHADMIMFSSPVEGVILYEAMGTVAPVAMALDVDANGAITDVAVDSFFDIYMDAAHDMELATPGSYIYGAGTPIAYQDYVGEAVLPLSSFCISMGGLGGETEPLDPAPMTGEIILTTEAATSSVTITLNTLRGGVVGTDGEPMTAIGLPLVVRPGCCGEPELVCCFDSSHPDYEQWCAAGTPECWCYLYQCHGDADGREEGDIKKGYFYVSYSDISLVSSCWKSNGGDTSASGDYPTTPGCICADFSRSEEGDIKKGYYRVSYADIGILSANWKNTTTDTTASGDDPYAHTCGGCLPPTL